MMYGSWDIEHDRQNFLSFWNIYCPFTPLTIQKIKILEKMKKNPADIIILHMLPINDNHVIYGSWDIEHHGQNFLSFWTIFCPFTSLTTQKIKIFKKWKKLLELLSLYTGVPKMTIIWCMVPEIWSKMDRIFLPFSTAFHKYTKNHGHMLYCSLDMACNGFIFHFGLFFALLPL